MEKEMTRLLEIGWETPNPTHVWFPLRLKQLHSDCGIVAKLHQTDTRPDIKCSCPCIHFHPNAIFQFSLTIGHYTECSNGWEFPDSNVCTSPIYCVNVTVPVENW
jgi:hypothetical protein